MDSRAARLISELEMRPHPEGGYFAELFRSPRAVDPLDGRGRRSALTGIWFLMLAGQRSAWHVVDSDEIWLHFEGADVRLWTFDAATGALTAAILGPLAGGKRGSAPQRIVPAGLWQAAEPLGDFSLTGACVGPGFDFADFRMLADEPVARAALERTDRDLLRLL
ncbi:MAG: cupin domain-containing protein [Thermoanaerobaculia bacterium]|nr:cupin domain-containing protein [Thermoanaerobaculia bacterium]